MSESRIPPAIAKIAPDGNLTPRQKRHFLIEMSLRRVRPGTGSGIEFLRRRTALNPWPDLRGILHKIPWAIVGGVATRAYMPERMTQDLDVIVEHSRGQNAIQLLKEAGFVVVKPLGIAGFLLRSPEGVEVDVLFGNEPWLRTALKHPEYDAAGYPVLGLPYLVLMKMNSGRTQDWADVSRMLGVASDEALSEVRRVVARYSPDDSDDLESLIFLGGQEFEPPQE